ncbi:uncharacterized protein [Zea mays]|uniref:Cysteine-rich TM module stress tolerance protein n=2 Tax=Zea mays TaxID=4577 RepID=A0A1D6L826_MAIZE|nr:uncharacterized protein LOC100277083 isoform X1 [Zea mays]ONM10402.1 cysteine-rich TM module stress tolerance protein [Zea mays]|eukprot:XP_008665610.1 uncharacterized protein LOC100277083 [Zea mays]
MSDPKYAYPYPAQGYYQGPYQGPPVMAPPQYAAPPPRREPSFLEGWYVFPAGQLSDPLSIIPLPQVYCAGSVVSVLCG